MPQDFIDLVRILHLVFFALGMGSGLFFDWRAMRRFHKPFSDHDLAQFHEVHRFVFIALSGLWLTGLALIYIRTGFQLSEFSPKLWTKMIVVTALTANAFVIGHFVLPCIARAIGQRAMDMKLHTLICMTATTSLSIFCWLAGLVLGASVTLKTADWTLLGSLLLVEFVVIVFGAIFTMLTLRLILLRRTGNSPSRS